MTFRSSIGSMMWKPIATRMSGISTIDTVINADRRAFQHDMDKSYG